MGPLDTRRLVITLGHARPEEHHPDGTCPVHDLDMLLEQVLESRTVLVERRNGAPPFRLRSRAAHESEIAWLTRVLTEVLGHISDTALACALVSDAIRRTAGVPVSIECWATERTGPQPIANRSTSTWRNEIPLVRSARGVWMLVFATNSAGLEAKYSALLAALARCLSEADTDDVRAQNALRQQLAHAVSGGDAVAFVGAASQLLGGSVCLRDCTGSVVAASGPGIDSSGAREIVLRDESGLRGALVIGLERELGVELGLADLALALLRLRAADGDRVALENRLAVLGCFVDHELDDGHPARSPRIRRMVIISRTGQEKKPATGLLVSRLLHAAAEIPLLADLSVAVQNDIVLGVYSDDGSDADTHRHNWERLLNTVDHDGALRVAVSPGANTQRPNDSKAQHQLISQVSRLQRDGVSLFDLPTVAIVDELGPLTGVLSAVPEAQVLPYVQRILGDLLTDRRFGGQLIETLYAYLQTGGSPHGAGLLLHLHRSSVKYRMRILRELLGERLDDPNKRFDIELALRLYLAGRDLAVVLAR